MRGRVLVIAGSDSGGGAGVQADIKTITALGGYAATAVTALTAQDTNRVHAIHDVPADFVKQQIDVVLQDIGADAIKIGMLHRIDIVETVASVLRLQAEAVPIVLDPVLVATSGDTLAIGDVGESLKTSLFSLAQVLTPNLPEAAKLLRREDISERDMKSAALDLLALGPSAILLKGGHLRGDRIIDVLATRNGVEEFIGPRIATKSTHGTGCTLASAIATGLAQKLSLRDAVIRARHFVFEAIRRAPGFGHGHGPLNHAHPFVTEI